MFHGTYLYLSILNMTNGLELQVPIIGLCMGERGVISRILCPKFGGYLTFGTLGAGKESAPGQPTMSDLLEVYRIKQIGVDTKVYGLIGKPLAQSKSPKLHNALFKSIGLNAVYVPFLTDNLANFLNTYSSPDFVGFRCVFFFVLQFLNISCFCYILALCIFFL